MTIVRDAVAADAAAMASIYAHHVLHGTATFEVDPPDAGEMERRRQRHADNDWPWLVAESQGAVHGYAYAAQFRDRAAYVHTAETSIYLDRQVLRRGLGTLLLESLIERASARGFEQLIAVIGDSGNAASIGLHRACGFVHAGLLTGVGLKFGRRLDVVYMQRRQEPRR